MPPIPVIEVGQDDEPAVAAALAEPARLAMLIRSARRTYSLPGYRLADHLSRRWAGRTTSPYAGAVAAVDRLAIGRGAYLLNHAYEWGCTSRALPNRGTGGVALLRTLDWPFDGLGRALLVTTWDGGGGPYRSVTWPGLVGVLTGLADGRFAACINQPPLPLPGWGKAAGWAAARARVWSSRAMPPSHLLRLAFDTCANFAEAVALIAETPICLPAIFTLAGVRPGEAIVIERTEAAAFISAEPAAANHWASCPGPRGRPRNRSSQQRRAAILALGDDSPEWSLDWVRPPIWQHDTRVALMADARSGRLLVQGLERHGPATALLSMPQGAAR